MYGGNLEMFRVTVDFPFSGSSEVLQYRANGQSLSIDNIYQVGGRAITVEVELRQLDKTEALTQAKKLIATTLQLVEQNNPFVRIWSAQIEPDIKEKAKQKRKELLDFFS